MKHNFLSLKCPSIRISLGLVFCAIVYLLFCSTYFYSFNYHVGYNKHIYFFSVVVFALTINELFIAKFINENRHNVIKTIFIWYLGIISFSDKLINNEHFTVIISFVMIFIILYSFPFHILKLIFYFICLIFFVELVVGIAQVFIFFQNNRDLINGTFNNNGVYSCYLVLHLPIVFYNIDVWNIKRQKVLKLLIGICVATIVILVMSRTAMLMIIIFSVLWLLKKKEEVVNNKISPIVRNFSIFLSVIILAGIFSIMMAKKMPSLYGRLLKWEVCLNNIDKISFTGIGIGRVSYYYPIWQMEYFKTHQNADTNFQQNADESYLLFNEPIEILFEVGIFGFFLICAVIVLFFFKRSRIHTDFFKALRISVFCSIIASLTTYIYHVNVVLMLVTLCLVVHFKLNEYSMLKFNFSRYQRLFSTITLIALLVTVVNGLHHSLTILSFEKLLTNDFPYRVKLKKFRKIESKLSGNGKFLINYGSYLYLYPEEYPLAINVLEKSKKYFLTKNTFFLLGEIYTRRNDYKNAIHNYQELTYFIPSLYTPKYRLALLYFTVKDYQKSKELVEEILTMPTKIQSMEVDFIKDKAKDLMIKIDSCK